MVRYGKREDFAAVNEIRAQVNKLHEQNEPKIFKKDFSKVLQDWLNDVFDNPNKILLVDAECGQICGYAILVFVEKKNNPMFFEQKFVDVDEIGVREEFRGKGVGKKLMARAKIEAKKRGFGEIRLTVWEFNKGAIGFYEALGFETFNRKMRTKI